MHDKESYFTVRHPTQVESRVKASRFIAQLHSAVSKDAVEDIILEIARKHTSATHNCFAYRLGIGDNCVYRADDAGEPAGTAGKPILQALQARKVSDAALVVTRYFGGTKLGIGGLIRAYSEAAFSVLDNAELELVEPTTTVACTFAYEETGKVHKIVNIYKARILETKYNTQVRLIFLVLEKYERRLKDDLINITRGKILFK
jgi:uncharacterized YigZ family protein